MAYFTKTDFVSDFFKGLDGTARSVLDDALRRDPAHIMPSPGPRSSGDWIAAIQQGLNMIQAKNSIDGMSPIPASETDFGRATVSAVLAYKKDRDIRGPGQAVPDPIVGRSTLAHMDDDIDQLLKDRPRPDPIPPTKIVDVVINVMPGGNEGGRLAQPLLADQLNTEKYKKSGKRLVVLAFVGSHQPHLNPSDGIVSMTIAVTAERRGTICMFGSSVGGKNILEIASKLTAKQIPLAYVGISDGAFFDPDAVKPPGILDSTSDLQIRSPMILATETVNFFTLVGTHIRPSKTARRLIWTGDLAGEIHGPIAGFQRNVNLTKTVAKGPSGAEAHDQAVQHGDEQHRARISGLLGST